MWTRNVTDSHRKKQPFTTRNLSVGDLPLSFVHREPSRTTSELSGNAAKNQNRVQHRRWFVDEFNSLAEEKGVELGDLTEDFICNSGWAIAVCSAEPVEEVEFSGQLEVI